MVMPKSLIPPCRFGKGPLWQYVAHKRPAKVVRCDLKLREQLLSQITHTVKTKEGDVKVEHLFNILD